MFPLGVIQQQRRDVPSTLLNGLTSWWSLDESSSTRVDSHRSNDLTDNNTVTGATGKVATSSQFTAATGEYLDLTGPTDMNPSGSDFCMCGWIYADSIALNIVASSIIPGGAWNSFEWLMQYDGARLKLYMGPSPGYNATASTFGALSTGTWYFVYAEYDSATNLIGISINDGTLDTGAGPATPSDLNAAFSLGYGPTLARYWDGRIDEFAFWKGRKLTAAEITEAYNSGAGLSYADLSAPSLLTDLISWWTLDETTGSRVDTHGSNDLGVAAAPGYVSAKIGNGVDLNGTTQYLYNDAQRGLVTGNNDWSIAGWVNLDVLSPDLLDSIFSVTANNGVGSNTYADLLLEYRAGTEDRFTLSMYSSTTRKFVNASTFGLPSTGTWYFLYAYHDSVANELGISVNNGTIDTQSYTGTPNSNQARINIGRFSPSFPYLLNGKVDEMGLWQRLLTPAEVTELYNSGTGIGYPL
jgi:hypothetical protein